jgi:hypothetical protein
MFLNYPELIPLTHVDFRIIAVNGLWHSCVCLYITDLQRNIQLIYACGWQDNRKYDIIRHNENKTIFSRNNMLRYRTSFNKQKRWYKNFSPSLKLWKFNTHKLWIIEINVSKLHRINTTYTCRLQNNKFKWFIKFVCLLIHYSLTENNTTNLGVCLTGRCKSWSWCKT